MATASWCRVPLGVAAMMATASSLPAASRFPFIARPLTLMVSATADVPKSILQSGLNEVTAVFRRAGVEIVFGAPQSQGSSGDASAVRVAVIGRERRALSSIPRHVLGAVVQAGDSRETAIVLFDRIRQASERYDVDAGLILGHAIAHEVGHLLLPRGTHGASGLMQSGWRRADFFNAASGRLRFTPAEAEMIRDHLGRQPIH